MDLDVEPVEQRYDDEAAPTLAELRDESLHKRLRPFYGYLFVDSIASGMEAIPYAAAERTRRGFLWRCARASRTRHRPSDAAEMIENGRRRSASHRERDAGMPTPRERSNTVPPSRVPFESTTACRRRKLPSSLQALTPRESTTPAYANAAKSQRRSGTGRGRRYDIFLYAVVLKDNPAMIAVFTLLLVGFYQVPYTLLLTFKGEVADRLPRKPVVFWSKVLDCVLLMLSISYPNVWCPARVSDARTKRRHARDAGRSVGTSSRSTRSARWPTSTPCRSRTIF